MNGDEQMEDNYWLLGKVNIPEEKKTEFNLHVLEILDRCGIRKRKEITLAEKNITVLEKPAPDENGIVAFDYSIFEKKDREISTYNTDTCVLHTEDRGVGEFGLAMNLILLLQECYSNGSCLFMENRKPIYVYNYMKMLSTILERKIYNSGRERMWDVFLLMRNRQDVDVPSEKDAFVVLNSYDYSRWNDSQIFSILAITYTKAPETDRPPIVDRKQIVNAPHISRMEYLYRTMQAEYSLKKDVLESFLNKLLHLPLPERKQISKNDDNQGILAELSLYLPPACLVSIFALLAKKTFWDAWDAFANEKYYTDLIVIDDSDPSEKWERRDFYKQILRDNQDEFLEFWNGENLVLSDEMQKRISGWKELFDETPDQPTVSVENYLADALIDLKNDWNCRYVDEAFIDNILNNKENAAWRRVLLVFRKIVDQDIELFPELDRKLAIKWIKTYQLPSAKKAIAAFCSLMTNDSQRYRLLGI